MKNDKKEEEKEEAESLHLVLKEQKKEKII